jgi:hypothetical protein
MNAITGIATASPKTTTSGKLAGAGLFAAAAAAAINTIAWLAFNQAGQHLELPLEPGIPPHALPVAHVVGASMVAALGATVALALLARFVQRPVRAFRAVAAAVLLLSFGGPLNLPVEGGVKLGLITLHLLTAIAIVGVLTVLPFDRRNA